MAQAKPYHCYNKNLFIRCSLALMVILFTACNNDDQTHRNHQAVATKTGSHDSMPGMEMSSPPSLLSDTGVQTNQMSEVSENDSIGDETYWLTLPTNQTVVASQQAIKPVLKDTVFSIPANGYITFDARRNHKVPVRVGGRIERLYVKFNYQYVHKGEKILELYSPELNTYVEEYLYVKRNTNDSLLQRRAKEKLLLLGLSPLQVKQMDKAGRAPFTIPMYSPFEGYVVFKPSANASMPGQANTSGGMSMSPGANNSPSIQATNLSDNSIREGIYIGKDQTLFWINDFKEVWGVLAFNKQNEKYIKKGQVAVVQTELLPEQSFRSVIQFTEPVYQQGQRFTQARIYMSNNRAMLKQNSLLTANIFLSSKAMMLPATSVKYLGRMAMVWVQVGTTKEGSNVFQSRVVQVGRKTGNQVEILAGIKLTEAVAKDASYLADSETIINY